MPRAPRRPAADRSREDSLLTDAEKRAAESAQKRENGFKTVDWASVDPQNIDPALVKTFQNNLAAKKWAKKPLDQPLSVDDAVSYIIFNRERHLDRLDSAQMRADAAKSTVEEARARRAEDLESRMGRYRNEFLNWKPQDEVNFKEMCTIEGRMERMRDAIDDTEPTNEDKLKMRALMTAEWQILINKYSQLQKDLGITKVQRDAKQQEQSAAEKISETMAKCALWMESELIILVCATCKTELAWVWWAFANVHDPRPYFFTGVCACGARIESGDTRLIAVKGRA